ncbi:MAG: hypothetical protein AAF721_40675 [Myxococcota bacterium]
MTDVGPEIRIRLCIEDLLRGRVPLFDGVEALLELTSAMPSLSDDRDVHKLAEVLSEAEHLPVGAARDHWQKEALHRADRELMALERRRQDAVFYACRRLLATLDA